ncbi:MAG: Hsp20/alpha crystallin family protein [Bacteroidetes bacterium]|nr:Hsp20/alpha crystallin family protein [Bacteroidota bacterium]MDA1121919.1 Hsp20/alpha crystallin family protein [Bacteroidota bacterium]
MSIVKWNGDVLSNFFDDFLLRDLSDWNNPNYYSSGTVPAVNINDLPDHFEVEMAAPGMTKNDFKVELNHNLLTISSDRMLDSKEEGTKITFTRREFGYGAFRRSFTLPQNVVEANKIKAKYENGLLTLLIPKKEEAKQRPPRMIEIS